MQPLYSKPPLWKRIGAKALDFLVTQWCLTLISWPIMLWWGLPVASLSPIGNFVFGPFLTLFLVLSLLITACAIIGFPLTYPALALDYVTNAWMYCMQLTPWDWYITCPRPPWWLVMGAPLGTILIMHYRPFAHSSLKRFGTLFIFSCAMWGAFSLVPTPDQLLIPYGKKGILVTKKDGELHARDCGFIRRKSACSSWIGYTLRAELAKKFGAQVIDHYYLDRLTPTLVAYVQELCIEGLVKNLHLPMPHKKDALLAEKIMQTARENAVQILWS